MNELIETIHDAFRDATPTEIAGNIVGAICVFAIPFFLLFIGHGLGY